MSIAKPESELPDREWGWSDPTEIHHGITIRHPDPDGSNYVSVGDGAIDHRIIGLVADGIDDYLDAHDPVELDVPQYYSRFDDEFETHVTATTAETGSNSCAYAITPHRLERAIRIAAGKGGFRHSDLTVYACGNGPFVVQYDGDAYVCIPDTLRSLPDGYEPDTFDVSGFSVPEGNEQYRDALATALGYLDRYDVTVTDHTEIRNGRHVFTTDRDRDLFVRGGDLRKIVTSVTDPDEVAGTFTIETSYDETYDAEWENVEYHIGDPYNDWYYDATGYVVGYKVTWEDPRTSSRVSMSGKITVDAEYRVLYFRDRSETRSYDELKVERETVRLGKFDPENEKYTWF